jgi:N6-adenosine-specific RNA methylase IME4
MDPEWRFEPYSRATGLDRAADNHYPTSDQRMLLMREIGKISAKDCMCAMWVTDLTNGIRLMESYGFQVKSRIIWVKDIVEGPAQRGWPAHLCASGAGRHRLLGARPR